MIDVGNVPGDWFRGSLNNCFLMYIVWFTGLKKELKVGDKNTMELGGSCPSW